MAKGIIDFWKRAANDITDSIAILDTSDILDRKKILDTSEILGMRDTGQKNKDDVSSQKKLKTHFVLCTSEKNKDNVKDDLTQLAFNLKTMVNGIFKQVLNINTEFHFTFCSDNELEEGLNFTTLEDFEDKRSSFELYNFERFRNKKYTNKTQLDRGIKVIEILPESTDSSLHSNAEKSGIVAHVYLHHLIEGGYLDEDIGPSIRQYKLVEFDITIIHEICHLFGLSDRYQFALKYKLGDNGKCLESISKSLIPIPIDPELDEEGMLDMQILNNLMYGADNFCLSLTTYQKNVILDFLDPEPDYDKVSVLIDEGNSFSTNSYNNKAKKRISFSGYKTEDPPIIGADAVGIYTYSFVDEKLRKDYTGQNIKFNGKSVGDKLKELLPLIVLDVNDNILPTSTDLGLEITSKNYCDTRTINPVISNSKGN